MNAEDIASAEVGRAPQRSGYEFVTVTPDTHRRVLARDPRAARDLRDVFGWNRPFEPALLPKDVKALVSLPWMRVPLAAGAVLFSLALSWPAAACPSCAAGQEARRQVWTDDFLYNLAAAALPFILVGAVSTQLHGIGRAQQRSAGAALRYSSTRAPRSTSQDGTQAT